MEDVRVVDWSREVAPFWGAVISTALSGAGVAGLLKAGWTTIKGALVMPLMAQGFQQGVISFVCIAARKPARP
jgi:tocopherol O-methyltransferase